MCGIAGCILKDSEAAPVLLNCLKRLEYRGYDSVGMATLNGSKIYIKKDSGKIDEVSKRLNFLELPGKMGIGHVRWATHGPPTQFNAHPHSDCNNEIVVVHNGIIENFNELKKELIKEGHKFRSETDTEVIAHLIEKYLKESKNLEEAARKTAKRLKGSYALLIMSVHEPDKIIGMRNESPLVVGISDHGLFLASDMPAVLEHTNKFIHLDEREMAIITNDDVVIKNFDGEIINKEIKEVDWTPEMAEKSGYDHFTIKEIHEGPNAIRETLRELNEVKKVAKKLKNIKRICFVACGTSYHASLVGKYVFEKLLGIPTDVILASEFKYSVKTLDKNTLVIFITQSGETADTISAIRMAKNKSKTLAIVNVVGSTATREAEYVIYTRAGPEIGVAATKTYLTQLTCIYMLAASLSGKDEIIDSLKKIPEIVKNTIKLENKIKKISEKYKDVHDVFFIGRGFSYPTALEGALKLKEISYIHAEGYAAGELKHGPLALIEENVPVVSIAPPGESYDKTLGNIEEVKARGSKVIALGSKNNKDLKEISDEFIPIDPSVDEFLSPLVYIVPLQLFAYYTSVGRGIDPDKPRNLAKSVTVE